MLMPTCTAHAFGYVDHKSIQDLVISRRSSEDIVHQDMHAPEFLVLKYIYTCESDYHRAVSRGPTLYFLSLLFQQAGQCSIKLGWVLASNQGFLVSS